MSMFWKKDPAVPEASREEARRLINGGAQAEVEVAFQEGVLIDYSKRVLDNGVDLEIRIVLRHNSVCGDQRPASTKSADT